ncbi:leucine-rich repeat transmembrane neuronal protein 3-like [Branchiostoma lanceolatum]|uniref:leucine-rich repeat transmembrane neuronal protein 3-like n=1 Tax=Branchiostoma lanceolatum TaxID=7740 RepID=UPI003451C35C
MDLTRIPQNLPTSISKLDLSDNQITSISLSGLTRYRNLRQLYLPRNRIANIRSGAFSNLPKLTTLSLNNNRITNLQPDVYSNLTKLYLDSNQIADIHPGAFSNPSKLKRLYLRYNQITDIGKFSNLTQLRFLHLDENNITDLQPAAFLNLTRLIVLTLKSNQITKIHPNTFANLSLLKYLYLDSNKIAEIQPKTFSNLPQLERLRLQSNLISVLPQSAYGMLAPIPDVTIDNNPWQCDCKMVSFRLKMNGAHSFENHIVCSQPAMFSGQKLKDINPKDLICKLATTPTMAPFITLPVHSSKISTVSVDGQLEKNSYNGSTNHPTRYHWHVKQNSGSTARPVDTTLPVNLSKISLRIMPVDGQLESRCNSHNSTTNHTSRYHSRFKQTAGSTARPVGTTFTTLSLDQSKPENNSSHKYVTSFPLPVLIASVCGSIAGVVLIGAIILTIWCKRRTKDPPSGPSSNIAFLNTTTSVDIPPNPSISGAGPEMPTKPKSPVPPRKTLSENAPPRLPPPQDDDDCVYVEPDGALYMKPEDVLYEMPANEGPIQHTNAKFLDQPDGKTLPKGELNSSPFARRHGGDDCVYVEPDGAQYMSSEAVQYEMPANSHCQNPIDAHNNLHYYQPLTKTTDLPTDGNGYVIVEPKNLEGHS